MAELAHNIVVSSHFNTLMITTILLAGITIGLQTDTKAALAYESYSNLIDTIIQAIFLLEVALKIISEDLKPWRYFNDSWNIFDFFVVMVSFVPTGSGSLVTMLRLLRLLRVMKLMKALPQLQNIIFALTSGTKSITYISVILVLYFYVYAILGQVLFEETDPHRFGKLHYAMLILFQMSTFDGWSDCMYTTQYGCDKYGYDSSYQRECKNPKKQWAESAIYWVIFVIIGGLVLLSLFIGVVGIGMEESNQIEKNNEKLLKKAAKLAEKENLTDDEIKLYKEVFDIVDFASGGSIGKQEMTLGLKIAGILLS
jgi:voltage-gated sodium channel